MNLNNAKYDWAKKMYTVMIWNFRVPEKISGLNEDSIQYRDELTDDERKAFDWIISFLIFLDSMQTANLPNLSEYITAPEVNLLLAIQTFQEAIHSQSYAVILESVVDAQKRDEIYYFWREDSFLLERSKYIGGLYQDFIDEANDKNFFKAIVADFLLEWLYFYNGFAFFDTLCDQQKMKATDRMINYIRRDELSHVTLFANMFKELRREFPHMRDEALIKELFTEAVQQEIKRSHHILGDRIVWINWRNTEIYTKRLANDRLRQIDIAPLYPDVGVDDNPYQHLARLQDNNGEKWNFFESTVTNYVQSNTMSGSREDF